jgi:hypothetical protein
MKKAGIVKDAREKRELISSTPEITVNGVSSFELRLFSIMSNSPRHESQIFLRKILICIKIRTQKNENCSTHF